MSRGKAWRAMAQRKVIDVARVEKAIAEAIEGVGISPNELDRNWEAANLVDGLFAIARAGHDIARALEALAGVKDGVAAKADGEEEEE